jgi:preprotein translocase YajC subunit
MLFKQTIQNFYSISSQPLLVSIIFFARLFTPFVALFFVWYFVIIKQQEKQKEKMLVINTLLVPGATVTTDNGLRGVVLYTFQHTIIIEATLGNKIEVHRQTISSVDAK